MYSLQTRVSIPNPGFDLNFSKKIMLLGSCFADNIGSRLKLLKFRVLHNPFGVIYNPASLASNLQLLLSEKTLNESHLAFHNELWFSFYHHSSFSSTDKKVCLNRINEQLIQSRLFLESTDTLFLTLGTSWIYKYKKSMQVVNNCHKLPAKEFDRQFLQPIEIVNELSNSINQLLEKNPALKIVLTISPIRHLKDGAIENQRSKASLLLAVKELEAIYSSVYYFPSYEIFMDELRDYRFYDLDMTHPSPLGINYIWQRFQETFFTEKVSTILNKVEKFQKGIQHRPFNTSTLEYSKFLNNLLLQASNIVQMHPELDLSEEIVHLKQLLSNI